MDNINLEGSNNITTKRKTYILVASLVGVAILIIGLVIGNIIVKLNSGKKEDETEQQDINENTQESENDTYEDIELAPISKTNYKDKFAIEFSDLEDQEDIDAIIELYQKYIDVFITDEEAKEIIVALYNDRISAILSKDFDHKYGKTVIADAIAIDNILQTVTSAAQVYNYAVFYEDQAVMDQYQKIINERSDTGDEADLDGRG